MERRGFTKLELVIVIVILVILYYTTSIPTMPHTKDRARISRVRSEMRSLAIALEAYKADHQVYPAMIPMADLVDSPQNLERAHGQHLMTIHPALPIPEGFFGENGYYQHSAKDPTIPGRELSYAYFTDGESWILIAAGLDRKHVVDDPSVVIEHWLKEGPDAFLHLTYDPTNGTRSEGIIWRIKGQF